MGLSYRQVVEVADIEAARALLSENTWPFHDSSQAMTVSLVGVGIESFQIFEGSEPVGIVRLLDLDDIPAGSPLFDLRIAEQHRGRGTGTEAVRWLCGYLFGIDEALHRIEATTRSDNSAMRSVLERCGFRLEGEFREAWLNDDGSRLNALAYGLLRSDWMAIATN